MRHHELGAGGGADPALTHHRPVPPEFLAARLTFVTARLTAGDPRAGATDGLVLRYLRAPKETHCVPHNLLGWAIPAPTDVDGEAKIGPGPYLGRKYTGSQ